MATKLYATTPHFGKANWKREKNMETKVHLMYTKMSSNNNSNNTNNKSNENKSKKQTNVDTYFESNRWFAQTNRSSLVVTLCTKNTENIESG